MAGDKKGKGKQVVQKKKRTREDRERERAKAVADAADRQGSLRIRDPQAQGSHSSSYVAQDVLVCQRQLIPHLSPALVHGLEVVVLTGQQAVTMRVRQLVRIVMQRRSLHRLGCLIFGAFQDLGSRD